MVGVDMTAVSALPATHTVKVTGDLERDAAAVRDAIGALPSLPLTLAVNAAGGWAGGDIADKEVRAGWCLQGC